ncbi:MULTISPECIES: IS1380 family transposase [Nocardiaceae]|uniref:Transposase DDE domain group 1 n=2 Tax=Nocardiaceae TaxID=85025 RepID=A0A1G8S8E9_9NOCA|nr:Transposase DDE domain group 1 [Rhodococcus triatomae]
MSESMSWYPSLKIEVGGSPVVSQAGAGLLLRTVEKTGLSRGLSERLSPWRSSGAVHDPGKVVCDLAVMLALGGDCVSDLALLRAEPCVFGAVASDPTVSRLITVLAGDSRKALAAIASARAQARARAWELAGTAAPDYGVDAAAPLTIDLDATLTEAHSDKEHAAPTFKRGFGFHPLRAFVDHGETGTGEPAAVMLRPGNAGSNTAHDHKQLLADALTQLPRVDRWRIGRKVLVRADSGGGTHEFLDYCHRRRVQYSIGFVLTDDIVAALDNLIDTDWIPALDAGGKTRPGAWVTEVTGLLDLSGWPRGMRLVVRKERPHPGAQLRFTDHDGLRLTAFVTNTTTGPLPELELRHRRRARCEDRIRAAKDTGLRNLPFHSYNANRIWTAIVALAMDLTAWTQILAFGPDSARRWEPKTLRLRLFSIPARLARHARRVHLRLPAHNPWTGLALTAFARLAAP